MFHPTPRLFGLCCLAFVLSLTPEAGVNASPLRVKQPALKDVERAPENFLGSRIAVEVWLGSEVKVEDASQELSVYHDAKTRANRLRFLASKSLADQVAALGTMKQATLTGTVAAPESVRAGYSFEVDEIAIKNADGIVTATLKPAVITAVKSDKPIVEPIKVEAPQSATKPKTAESQKKSDKVPTILIVVAVGLGVFLVVAGVVGMRLMKHLKKPAESEKGAKAQKRPAQSRIKISSEPAGRESR